MTLSFRFQTLLLCRALACLVAAGLVLAGCQSSPVAAVPPGVDPTGASTTRATWASSSTTPNDPATATADATVTTPPSVTNTATPTETATALVTPSPAVERMAISTGKIVLPILLYHHVSDQGSGRYVIPVNVFRKQMESLKRAGYETICISQLAEVIRTGRKLPDRPVAITFDDGYLDTYENAYPILRELNYTATVYIITGTLGTNLSYGYMQVDALKELAAAGWEIGSHSVTHSDLMKTKLGAGNEMKQSKKTLEDLLGVQVRSFSYPFGSANSFLKELAAHSGYDSGVGINILNTHSSTQLYYLSRREVYRDLSLVEFNQLLQPSEADHILATQSAVLTPTSMP